MINEATPQPVAVVEHNCLLGEGPVWDAKQKIICWVDILNGIIHTYSPDQNIHATIPVYQMAGAVAFCTDGNFIAALQNGFAFIDSNTGAIKMTGDPENHLPGNRFNDGKCDPAGRFWAGTMALSEETGAGSLYMLGKDLTAVKKIGNVSISNGMAWSADHTTFYYIDSPSFKVVAYDYDKITGAITNQRTIITIAATDGCPDGMTIDTDGMLWIAHWDGWQVTRWDPATGGKLFHFSLPVSKVTSCTFGGDNLQDLYITSASTGLSEEALKKQPLAGALFVIPDCGFRGMPAFEFVV
jgi:sugar lactone lactonase YvrE